MAVEDPERIDMIGIDKTTGEVILTVADSLDWSDEYNHLNALQAKLNTYIAFIEDGEIAESYPAAEGRTPVIEVVFRYQPPHLASNFLKRTASIAASLGIALRSRVKQ